MRKLRLPLVLFVILLLLPAAALAKVGAPLVSTDWLQKNLENPRLVVLDVRKVEEYKAGHIPNAVNAFYGAWAVKRGELLNELPAIDELFDTIGGAGIDADSLVVVVGKTTTVPDQFDMTRVAWTLKYAGVANVAVLDGGQNKWVKDGKAVSTDAVRAKAKAYRGKINRGLFVNKDYVLKSLGKAVILDVRAPDFYEGKQKLPFVQKAGRIKGAVNLPVGQLFTPEGLYKDQAALAALATTAVGADKSREIIAYCDTGKTCTAWAFILTDMLGYENVKIYDGSAMEWLKDPDAPAEP
ncbi:MAG: rhodanese-like domain-containing protein [Pseudomonadota bacterium]|nr:rhodanese-like domain-containing protein [Pseudomonadota bacterium]